MAPAGLFSVIVLALLLVVWALLVFVRHNVETPEDAHDLRVAIIVVGFCVLIIVGLAF